MPRTWVQTFHKKTSRALSLFIFPTVGLKLKVWQLKSCPWVFHLPLIRNIIVLTSKHFLGFSCSEICNQEDNYCFPRNRKLFSNTCKRWISSPAWLNWIATCFIMPLYSDNDLAWRDYKPRLMVSCVSKAKLSPIVKIKNTLDKNIQKRTFTFPEVSTLLRSIMFFLSNGMKFFFSFQHLRNHFLWQGKKS